MPITEVCLKIGKPSFEPFFVNTFLTFKAGDTIQTVLESSSQEKNYCSNIDLKFNDAWKSHGTLENVFQSQGTYGFQISQLNCSSF